MSLTVSIPASITPAHIPWAELKCKPTGTIAITNDPLHFQHRFVVISGEVIGFHANGSMFTAEGKGWDKPNYIVLPKATVTITFSE